MYSIDGRKLLNLPESAKSPAGRAHVLGNFTCLRACLARVLACLCAYRACVLTVLACLQFYLMHCFICVFLVAKILFWQLKQLCTYK